MTPEALLPVFVALPLIVAAVTALSPWRVLNSALSLIIPAVNLTGGVWLYAYTAEHGTIGHVIGLYQGGAGISFAGDQFSAIMLVTTMLVALISNWFAIVSGETQARYYTPLTLVLLTGVSGALLTADLFNFFVMIEVMLLPSYGLIAMTGTRHRLQSARLFVLVNLAASTFLVTGVGYVYAVTGAVNIGALQGAAAGNGPVTVAMGIVVAAICAKAAVFPLHTWLPRTYTSTSAAVMGLFSGLHTKVAVYMLFRIWVVIFDMDARWNWLIIAVMVVSMLVGAYAGLAESTIRQVLGYQMVNGMPFILVMLAFTQDDPRYALAAGLMYTLHHMVTIGALTLNSGAIEETYGTGTLSKLSGLARRDPLTATVFAAGAFSVIGFPPFSGLWGKLTIIFAAARGGDERSWIVIAAIIIASFGAMLAMFRVWRDVFWGKPMQRFPANLNVRGVLLAPSASLMLISLAMFFAAGPLWGAATDSVDALLDVPSYTSAVLGPDPVGLPDTASLQGGQ
ncbi:monovalent cation/H+ antiporter subunit D family protein [Corynebacterium sp. p3-SID1145]|uniref:monovalent cation/H+ antiporter subunit D family protein n=1 Tax=unclassified Corynebacterium TaxID=2624378 RepID=UPI0021AAC537|nr:MULTISPECIES: monovalent cation/H+ antiporter subunit D family protein [unclassified Corynebacterium]MCT1451661.1 monovalent cation/H+ antiporter subunit D family protein [Corynebacterium sp. p3-SID1145]MCT1460758.1 monovalent cation/H+ antiporter subunit D family protein [Corynebacterium sp. p3-SID1140]